MFEITIKTEAKSRDLLHYLATELKRINNVHDIGLEITTEGRCDSEDELYYECKGVRKGKEYLALGKHYMEKEIYTVAIFWFIRALEARETSACFYLYRSFYYLGYYDEACIWYTRHMRELNNVMDTRSAEEIDRYHRKFDYENEYYDDDYGERTHVVEDRGCSYYFCTGSDREDLYGIIFKRLKETNTDEEIRLIKEQAENNDEYAIYYLIRMYREGVGVEKNLSKASYLSRKYSIITNGDTVIGRNILIGKDFYI